ncbi:MAG TPA: thioredoxin family protein [Candidatus Sulfotelmatobacter sp.]|nr:thioredoxin family protein [Candidatus Sulfotelmatobacter sp.]
MRLSRLSWLPVVPLLFAAAVHAQDQPRPLAIGATAPMKDVKMKSVDGKDVTLTGVAGKKGTLVVFTCNHCPWAQAWQTRVAAIGNGASAKGIGVVAINPNDPVAYPEDDFAGMQARAKMLGLKFPYVVDATSDMARAFGATRTPEAFLFDASGKLVYHGTVDDNARDQSAVTQHWLQDAVDAVIAGKDVTTAETKAFGCGIKFREKKTS